MSWEVISKWIESHPGLASWVQSVGSIGAILVAIWVARASERTRAKIEKEKAIALHASVVELCRETLVSIENLSGELASKYEISQEPGSEFLANSLILLECLKEIQPLQLSDTCAVVPFLKVKAALESTMSYVHRMIEGDAYARILRDSYLPDLFSEARQAIHQLSQKC